MFVLDQNVEMISLCGDFHWIILEHVENVHLNNKKTHPSKQAMNLYYRSFGNHPNRVKLI